MTNKDLLVNLKTDRPIINILGEVCWGFKIVNFEKKIGATIEIVEKLLERLIKEEKKGKIDIYLSISEVEIIKKAFIEVKKEIEEWEFEIRIGVSLDEIKKIQFFAKLR